MPDDEKPRFTFEVHEYAARFAMLSDDKLLELAADIKQNGLREPIMLSTDARRLLDGRNRLSACGIAGVEPRFDRLEAGRSEVAYIISANIQRRHLNAGQQAIALVLADTGESGVALSAKFNVHRAQLREAREIVAYPDLAELVMSGAAKFDHALREARWRGEHAKDSERFLRELQAEAPELAEEVTEGKARLYDAWMHYRARQRAAAADMRKTVEAAAQGLNHFHVLWTPRLRNSEGFRAAVIATLKVEPERVDAYLDALDALVAIRSGEDC